MTQRTPAAALLAAAAALALSACAGPGEDGGAAASEQPEEAAALTDVVNENRRLEADLADAELRLAEACLEEAGHAVHDRAVLRPADIAELELLVETYPFDGFLPDADTAARWGFGQWLTTPEGAESDDAEEYAAAVYGEDHVEEEPDNSAWDELPAAEQEAWYEAYYGPDHLDFRAAAMGMAPGAGDGGIADAEPGGCLLAVQEGLYGPAEGDTGDGPGWNRAPQDPADTGDFDALREDYRALTADAEAAFLACLFDRGRGDWAFDDLAGLPLTDYFANAYYRGLPGYEPVSPESGAIPELPADLGEDYASVREHETALAVDFAACGDETGYRETAAAAWDAVQTGYYTALEDELFAYQDAMREALERAQDLLGA
ncbi:hypothetical protein [Glycomyces terrestris]|uniref:Uncharacterized protein n=1 Tax=Glycomyces terrestris TaxID=2493553 RepID=A0A426UU36_9ACTN|nr:hypothetical protein [Glycomyces terrestris]RRR97431.1 hypothetical protein EIW28_18675 [Glycomyces terrestris]